MSSKNACQVQTDIRLDIPGLMTPVRSRLIPLGIPGLLTARKGNQMTTKAPKTGPEIVYTNRAVRVHKSKSNLGHQGGQKGFDLEPNGHIHKQEFLI